MNKFWRSFLLCISIVVIFFSSNLSAAATDILDYYSITSIDSKFQTVTLSDGSVWNINSANSPNPKAAPWSPSYSLIWIRPYTQNGIFGVVLLDNYYGDCALATLKAPGTSVKIAGIDTTNEIISLSGNVNTAVWNIKPAYYNSYTAWQDGDCITVGGSSDGYFLINTTRKAYVGVTP